MGQPGGTKDGDDGEVPGFDEAWVSAAPRAESDVRRYQAPPLDAPVPWRTWTPPEQPTPAQSPPPPAPPLSAPPLSPPPPRRRFGVTGVVVLLSLIVAGAVAVRGFPSDTGGPDGLAPVPSGPVPAPDLGTTLAIEPTAQPPATVGRRAVRPPTFAVRPAPPTTRPPPWSPAATVPPTGPDAPVPGVTFPDAFTAIKVGTCLTTTPDYRTVSVSCSGPHTDEVTVVRDLTATFPTTPTPDQLHALDDQLCPAAALAWTGGASPGYTTGFLWRFDDGVPGQVVRSFACTVMLAGHGPFQGTLRNSVS